MQIAESTPLALIKVVFSNRAFRGESDVSPGSTFVTPPFMLPSPPSPNYNSAMETHGV
jgi:hypothetical protein